MAARLRKTHQEDVRLKIQASQLVNRLQDHVFKETELSLTQMKAIEILLRKSLPDLSATSIELFGKEGAPAVNVKIVPAPVKTKD